MLLEDERMPLGWVKILTCIHCSYQDYERPAETIDEISAALKREAYSHSQAKRPLDGLVA
jgi:hypothetical protein